MFLYVYESEEEKRAVVMNGNGHWAIVQLANAMTGTDSKRTKEKRDRGRKALTQQR